ncbi:MAG: hypothetical protein ACE5IH_07540, partial [Thermodesulfobacteriota bacterium]
MNKRFSIIIVILFVLVLPVYLQAGGLDDSLRVVSSDENGIVLELEAPWPDIAEVQERGTLY